MQYTIVVSTCNGCTNAPLNVLEDDYFFDYNIAILKTICYMATCTHFILLPAISLTNQEGFAQVQHLCIFPT